MGWRNINMERPNRRDYVYWAPGGIMYIGLQEGLCILGSRRDGRIYMYMGIWWQYIHYDGNKYIMMAINTSWWMLWWGEVNWLTGREMYLINIIIMTCWLLDSWADPGCRPVLLNRLRIHNFTSCEPHRYLWTGLYIFKPICGLCLCWPSILCWTPFLHYFKIPHLFGVQYLENCNICWIIYILPTQWRGTSIK